jgi:hypothetical protein
MFKFSKLDTERLVAGMSDHICRLLEWDVVEDLLILLVWFCGVCIKVFVVF